RAGDRPAHARSRARRPVACHRRRGRQDLVARTREADQHGQRVTHHRIWTDLMSDSRPQISQKTFRIGVVGTGSMGRNHARIFGGLEDASLSAVFDERADVAREIAAQYRAQAVANLEEFTNAVDAATIATPTVTHFAIAKHLLEHGKHVLV